MCALERLGLALVVGDDGKFVGIYTDGDLRRAVEKGNDFLTKPISKYMSRNPKTISADALVKQALSIMEKHSITSLAVLDADRGPIGVIHLHDILRRKVV
ncbi:MAG: CBS domain-containing protein [Candidatus Zixiibacteriota bacterium]